MADDIDTARELATHAAEIKHLQDDMKRLIDDMEDIKKCIHEIQSTLSEAKGGWRMLMLIGGASGALGAAIGQALHWVTGR
jgi:hypothetical protein